MAKAHPIDFKRVRPDFEKGRGARSNASGRYESERRTRAADGWDSLADDLAQGRKTDITFETPRHIITRNTSPYVGFDRSINPYRGCEHGCIYCFARPTHTYLGHSAGLDFETRLYAKPDGPRLLEKELSKPSYRVRTIAIGTNTDAYQPIERQHRIMRRILETLWAFRHPVSVLTKSDLILRDLDILGPMAENNLTRCMMSITTQDRALARSMEPRAPTPDKRFKALAELAAAGIPAGVVLGPMIPGLNDSELEAILERARDCGASFAAFTVIRLPLEVSPLFQEWLAEVAPDRAGRVMRHIRDLNGGKDYDPEWSRGKALRGTFAKLIGARFEAAQRRLGLTGTRSDTQLDTGQFRVPSGVSGQGDLFGP